MQAFADSDSQRLLAQTDVFAQEQQAKQDQLDRLLDVLAPQNKLQAQDDGDDEGDDGDGDSSASSGSDDNNSDNEEDDGEDEDDEDDTTTNDNLALAADRPAADLAALQSFLASDAAQQDKVNQLVDFLADGPATDVFADEQAHKQKALEDLVDSLATNKNGNSATATALLATDAADVDIASSQTSFLSVVGGAVVLLAAVVLAVITKRSRSKREKTDGEDKDFGYILYE
ncbi:uncharacterized protein IUM83_11749 [Phytophthora cinnamomi]|uniref:uncharacterized protein n=1 Tax=Phytophthora cinnamomi TaxID=4785 RepID=UPI00355A13CC|nr:hypothetical protein IUM83_11749 [Phytophthora cinnamomi]